jgi:hypothetical protein
MTRAFLAMTITIAVLAAGPVSAANDQLVMVLHALSQSSYRACTDTDIARFDCSSPADVRVTSGQAIDAVLFLYDFDEVSGVQCRFAWPADWTFQGWMRGCGANQIYGLQPSAGSGELATVFDAVTRPARVMAVGWMSFMAGASGCLTIEESAQPFGTHVYGAGQETAIPAERRGTICVGFGGVDGCSLGRNLSESSWGAIKSGYEQ